MPALKLGDSQGKPLPNNAAQVALPAQANAKAAVALTYAVIGTNP